MRKQFYPFLLAIPFLIWSCEKEETQSPEQAKFCSEFGQLLLAEDTDKAEENINQFLQTKYKNLTSTDPIQHKENYENLIKQINACPDLQVVHACYECIYTLPAQSEITITITNQGRQISKTIDLQLINNTLTVTAIHH